MVVDHRAELAGIKRFDQLVRYLRDSMGWPIEADDFEEMTFEYTPEELGIDTGMTTFGDGVVAGTTLGATYEETGCGSDWRTRSP